MATEDPSDLWVSADWDLLADAAPDTDDLTHVRIPMPPDLYSWLGESVASDFLLAASAAAVLRYRGGPGARLSVGGDQVEVRLNLEATLTEAVDAARARRHAAVPADLGVIPRAQLEISGSDLVIGYRAGCSEGDARRLGEQVHTLLRSGLDDPDRPLSHLRLVSQAQESAMAGGGADAASGETILDLLDRTFATYPTSNAVRCADRALTYSELDRASSRAAAALASAGIGVGSLVGVWAHRDVDLITSLVAVLRTGAAYVALEPSYPVVRLRALVEQAGIRCVMTSAAGLSLATEAELGVTLIAVPAAGEADGRIAQSQGPTLISANVISAPKPAANDLAYVMFTSGSTGAPKGVMVEHRNVVNLLEHMSVSPGLHAGDSMLGVTTPAFDLSVPDLFLPLSVGASLTIATTEQARDPLALATLIAESSADLMQATPSTWRLLVDSGWTGLSGLRIVCGGEAFDAVLANRLSAITAGVWNFYGPTETTVWSVSRLLPRNADRVTMGKSIRGTACYVLDSNHQLMPAGVRGELYIAGAGVSRGYLGEPELTAQAFLPCPFTSGAGPMYRTGDLVRCAEDGELTFVGRADHQVKLRGYRIELGEIESALLAEPGVNQAVAVVRARVDGLSSHSEDLIAYVTGSALDPDGLRQSLAAALPPQMVPVAVVVLEVFPLNANGKVDRSRLPAPTRRESRNPSATPLQQVVADVWSTVIGITNLSMEEDCFALGANSLDVGRAAVRLTGELGVDVSPALIFANPILSDLASKLLGVLASSDADETEALLSELEALA